MHRDLARDVVRAAANLHEHAELVRGRVRVALDECAVDRLKPCGTCDDDVLAELAGKRLALFVELGRRIRTVCLDGLQHLLGEGEELVVVRYRFGLAADGDHRALAWRRRRCGSRPCLRSWRGLRASPRSPCPAREAARWAASMSPFVSTSARLTSIIGAPVWSRSSLTSAALMTVIRPAPPRPSALRGGLRLGGRDLLGGGNLLGGRVSSRAAACSSGGVAVLRTA